MNAGAAWVATSAVVAVSAAVQGMTGFGFAVLAVPILVVLHDPRDAVVLAALLSTVGAVVMWWRTRLEIRTGAAAPLVVGGLAGLPLGLLALHRFDAAWLKLGAGLVTLAFGAALLVGALRRPLRWPIDQAGPGPAATAGWRRLVTGIVSGILAGSLGMPGPPLMVLLHHEGARKRVYRATSFAYFILIYPVVAIGMIASGLASPAVLLSSVTHLPALALGTLLGDVGHDIIAQHRFTLGVLGLLAAAGAMSVLSGAWGVLDLRGWPW